MSPREFELDFSWLNDVDGEPTYTLVKHTLTIACELAETTSTEAWQKYEANVDGICWPILYPPTALDLESIKDVLTHRAIRLFFLHYAPQHVGRRERVELALKRWDPNIIEQRMHMVASEHQESVRKGGQIVRDALQRILEDLDADA